MFRLHILPVMGDLPISKILSLECQNFITEKARVFKNIKQIKSYTEKVFDFAIKMKLLKHNPMAEIIMPKRKKTRIEKLLDGSRTSGVFSHSTSERALQALRTISATSL